MNLIQQTHTVYNEFSSNAIIHDAWWCPTTIQHRVYCSDGCCMVHSCKVKQSNPLCAL